MSRLHTIHPTEATGATAAIFTSIKKAVGKVPNAYATIGSQSPEALSSLLATDATIAEGTLSRSDIEVVKLVVSEMTGCDYCVAAHTLLGKMAGLSEVTMRQVRAGAVSGVSKRDALVHFVRTLVSSRGTLPAQELNTLRGKGYSDRQVVEIAHTISAITFTNLVNRINDTVVDFPAVL